MTITTGWEVVGFLDAAISAAQKRKAQTMNHIVDDRGATVLAIGAPNSIARIQVTYPELIGRLNALFDQAYECPGKALDEALGLIRASNIRDERETLNILEASQYGTMTDGSVMGLVRRVTK